MREKELDSHDKAFLKTYHAPKIVVYGEAKALTLAVAVSGTGDNYSEIGTPCSSPGNCG